MIYKEEKIMPDKEMKFEDAMKRLEEIVRFLESGNAPLDQSLSIFEEGVKLVKFCNSQLDSAEKRVKLLSFDSDGNATETDMPEMSAN